MSDGRIDGKFIIVTDLSTGIKDELGLTADDCKNMGSIWNEIVQEAQSSIKNNNESKTFDIGTLIEIVPAIWQKIVNTVNQRLNKNIEVEEPNEYYDNINLGDSEILKYYEKYPDKKSDTLTWQILKFVEKYRNDENKLNSLKKNPAFSTLVSYLEKYKDDQSFQELVNSLDEISPLTKEYKNFYDGNTSKMSDEEFYNKLPLHNCGDRAHLIRQNLEKQGIESTTIEICDLEYFRKYDSEGNSLGRGEHAFCVIGMDKEADTTDPNTWGKNAVIVDAWAGRTFSVKEGLEYFKEFFMFDDEHKMYIGTSEDLTQKGLQIRPDIFQETVIE